ncbi:hypothetical protein BUE80_DR009589 [Diplocarpon rosae]|nr:hypothetical protein BUE80_DR009589 [Diplocarpon rosae]
MASPSRTANRSQAFFPPEAPKESVISRLVITPVAFLSFLLSLALIDSHNHNLRHSHSLSRAQPTTLLGQVRQLLHSLVFTEVGEKGPYAYVKSPGSREMEPEKDANSSPDRAKEEPWHWHTKQRKMMRAEMEDAFKLRKWVVIALIIGIVSAAVVVWMLGRWVISAFGGMGMVADGKEF